MMKYRIIQISLLVFTAALIISFVPRSGVAQETGKVKVVWGSGIVIPDAGKVKDMEARRLVNRAVDQGEFVALSNQVLQKSISRKARIDANRVERVGDSLAWRDKSDPSSFIMQDSINGNLVFSNQFASFVTRANVSLPTKNASIGIARKFLTDLKLAPVDFEAQGELLHSEGLYTLQVNANSSGAGEEIQKLQTLTFGRKLEGYQINGGGSKIVMSIGDEGKVVNLEKRWNAIKLKQGVKSPELKLHKFETFKQQGGGLHGAVEFKLKEGYKQKLELGEISRLALSKFICGNEVKTKIIDALQDEWTTPDLIKVNSIELVYFDRGGNWIQPAYAYQADIIWGDEVAHYLFHTPALRVAPESIVEELFIEGPHISEGAANMEVLFD